MISKEERDTILREARDGRTPIATDIPRLVASIEEGNDLIERLITSGWVESGPNDNRVRTIDYDPTERPDHDRPYCRFCGARERWFGGPVNHIIHRGDCAWIAAMELLGHPAPEGHYKEGWRYEPGQT